MTSLRTFCHCKFWLCRISTYYYHVGVNWINYNVLPASGNNSSKGYRPHISWTLLRCYCQTLPYFLLLTWLFQHTPAAFSVAKLEMFRNYCLCVSFGSRGDHAGVHCALNLSCVEFPLDIRVRVLPQDSNLWPRCGLFATANFDYVGSVPTTTMLE